MKGRIRIILFGQLPSAAYREEAVSVGVETRTTAMARHLENMKNCPGLDLQVVSFVRKLDRPWIEKPCNGYTLWLVRCRSERPWADGYSVEKNWLREALNRINGQIAHFFGPNFPAGLLTEFSIPSLLSLEETIQEKHGAVKGLRTGAFQSANRVSNEVQCIAPTPSLQLYGENGGARQVIVMLPFLYPAIFAREPDIRRKTTPHYIFSYIDPKSVRRNRFLLNAYVDMRNQLPSVRLRLVSSGNSMMNESVLKQIRRLNLVAHIDCRPLDPGSSIWCDEIAGSSAVVDVALEESVPELLLSAMALGLPVVGQKENPSHEWALEGGQLGILVKRNDPKLLSKAMIDAINPPRHTLHKAAAYIRKLTDPERLRAEWMMLYHSIYE